jgi:hypothetical protein
MNELVAALGELGVWVRLHYVYPYPHVDEVIPLMAEGTRAALPRRAVPAREPAHPQADEAPGERREQPRACPGVAGRLPGLTLRSTFIVGFPGETEAEFEELLDFLDEAELDRVGCFAYSPVPVVHKGIDLSSSRMWPRCVRSSWIEQTGLHLWPARHADELRAGGAPSHAGRRHARDAGAQSGLAAMSLVNLALLKRRRRGADARTTSTAPRASKAFAARAARRWGIATARVRRGRSRRRWPRHGHAAPRAWSGWKRPAR